MNETERELGNMREVQEQILAQLIRLAIGVERVAAALEKMEKYGIDANVTWQRGKD